MCQPLLLCCQQAAPPHCDACQGLYTHLMAKYTCRGPGCAHAFNTCFHRHLNDSSVAPLAQNDFPSLTSSLWLPRLASHPCFASHAITTLRSEYITTMRGVRAHLLARSAGGLLYVAELVDGALVPKMDHLVCFLPGLLALGHLHGVNTGEP